MKCFLRRKEFTTIPAPKWRTITSRFGKPWGSKSSKIVGTAWAYQAQGQHRTGSVGVVEIIRALLFEIWNRPENRGKLKRYDSERNKKNHYWRKDLWNLHEILPRPLSQNGGHAAYALRFLSQLALIDNEFN